MSNSFSVRLRRTKKAALKVAFSCFDLLLLINRHRECHVFEFDVCNMCLLKGFLCLFTHQELLFELGQCLKHYSFLAGFCHLGILKLSHYPQAIWPYRAKRTNTPHNVTYRTHVLSSCVKCVANRCGQDLEDWIPTLENRQSTTNV